MNLKKLTYSSLAAVCLASTAVTASAMPIINLDGGDQGGNVSYNGDNNGVGMDGNLVGSQIDIATIFGTDLDQNNGRDNSLDCNNCRLQFSTGTVQQEGSENGGVQDPYIFDNDERSFFEITGTATDQNGDSVSTTNTILTGTLTGNSTVTSNGENDLQFSSQGTDTKDPGILNYFGIDPNADFEFSNTLISLDSADFQSNGGFDADVTSASVDNSQVQNGTAVPEPQELGMLLFGFALLGLGVMFRRKNGFDNQA